MRVILTEKPSVARDIAAFLNVKQKNDGYFEGNGYCITWAFGHLISLKDPSEYDPALKKWSLATIPFIPEKFELKVSDDKGIKKQFGVIRKLFKSAKEIICATDAGREGELIFRYILTMTECEKKPWKRLWLSSLTDEALSLAFANLKDGQEYNNLYAAAKCRSEADWIVGLNVTRNFTVRFGRGKFLWTVGRVQTPVLALIVNRDDEIHHFKSEPYFEIFTKYRGVDFKFKGDRFKVSEEAQKIIEKIKDHFFTIDNVSSKKENEYPPLLYDLTELQREMNRKKGMTAADTLQIAQTLYEQKLITYPRTDSRYIKNDQKAMVAEVLNKLKSTNSNIGSLNLNELNFTSRMVNDKKVTDHHAIIPTGKTPMNLSLPSQAVFDAILTRLIAGFYPTCVKNVTTVDGNSNGENFQAKGVQVVDPGWTVLYKKEKEEDKKDLKDGEPQELPLFEKGEKGSHHPYIHEGKTKPPAHFNENSLLGAMETAGKLVDDETLKEALKERGLGTPATRASIIETLIKRKYIERSGKSLQALDLGRYLIALIQNASLKSAEMTGEWEAKLKEIEHGKYNAEEFMKKIAHFTKEVIHTSDINQLNPQYFGKCPKCQSEVVQGKIGFGCSKWKEGCDFKLFKKIEGLELSDYQVQVLLQKKILLETANGLVVYLTEKGAVSTIKMN